MKKSNKKLLGVGIVAVAVVVLIVVFMGRILPEKAEWKEDPVRQAQVETTLSELNNQEVKGLLFSMYPLDTYDVSDILTYRGINTIMLPTQLNSGKELVQFLKQALKEKHSLEAVYVGVSMEEITALQGGSVQAGLVHMFADVFSWDDELLEIIKLYPEIRFHIMVEYPQITELYKKNIIERARQLKWYSDLTVLFSPQEACPNMILFLPEAEEWLVTNQANYLENGQPNYEAAKYVLGQMTCNDKYSVNLETRFQKLAGINNIIKGCEEVKTIDSEYTFVFFGDSVIGNYTDSLSIPGVVSGYTDARIFNCGYGGLSAAKKGADDIGFADIVDAFLTGEYVHYEEGKPVKEGTKAFHAALDQIDTEKLVFFISLGLNDYMSSCDLEGAVPEDIATFKGAMEYGILRLQEAYPDSEVILLTPNYLGMFENGTEVHNGHVFKEFVDTVIVLGEELDLKCIDVFHESGIDGETGKVLLADWVHPSVYGRFEVGKLIAGYLCDWYPGEK